MHGTPTHRRFEVLSEPVDLDAIIPVPDVAPVPEPRTGPHGPLDVQVDDAPLADRPGTGH